MALPLPYQKEYGHIDKIKFNSLLTNIPLTYLKLDQTTPQTTVGTLTWPMAKFGGASNYSEFESDGTYRANGNATTFRDELGDITKLKVVGNRIVFNDTESTLDFNTATTYANDYVWTNVQLNHDRLLTASIKPHIHYFQDSSNIPNFMLQYRWQINGGTKVTSWTNYKCNTTAFTYTSGTIHQILYGAGISVPVGTEVSDIVQFRVIRDNANASGLFSGADPLNATVGIMSFDTHIDCDTLGSRTEYSK